eukprot:TRINITY_DN4454_c0_g1_i1.p1 TRINITY_DN4454_c0_g1~~TRINITY_DN4454_c0_g1_i1.p1  ORF type:complete len:320 (-),score=33.06 TRINITY_DN4454_c0_g1_i1:14-973(-)
MLDFKSFDDRKSDVGDSATETKRSRKRKLEDIPAENTHKLLKMDERSVLGLDVVSPFYDYTDLWNRLVPFHVFMTEGFTPAKGESEETLELTKNLLDSAATLTQEFAKEVQATAGLRKEDSLLVQRLIYVNEKQAFDAEKGQSNLFPQQNFGANNPNAPPQPQYNMRFPQSVQSPYAKFPQANYGVLPSNLQTMGHGNPSVANSNMPPHFSVAPSVQYTPPTQFPTTPVQTPMSVQMYSHLQSGALPQAVQWPPRTGYVPNMELNPMQNALQSPMFSAHPGAMNYNQFSISPGAVVNLAGKPMTPTHMLDKRSVSTNGQ